MKITYNPNSPIRHLPILPTIQILGCLPMQLPAPPTDVLSHNLAILSAS